MIRRINRKFRFLYKYTGKWISRYVNFWKRKKGRKKEEPRRILLYCNAPVMEEHLLNYMEQMEGESCRFFLFFGYGYTDGPGHPAEKTLFREKEVRILRHHWQMFCRWWDLIVCADLEYPFWMFRGTVPLLYIGHGISNVSYDGGKTVYDYGPESRDEEGRFLFDVILEPNRRVAALLQEQDEECRKRVRHTGYRFADRIRTEAEKCEFYRKQLKISSGKPVVSFFGSWNRESLFHVLGEELFEACERLKDKYTFIFSIHPREYRQYDENIRPMGELVERQRGRGHLVRSPGEDWVPYIMASDVVVVDYSTMMSLAILAGKKVMLSDFPDEKVGTYSLAFQVKKTCPVLRHASELKDSLEQVLESPVFDRVTEQFREELYVSKEAYRQRIKDVTEEMIRKGRQRY